MYDTINSRWVEGKERSTDVWRCTTLNRLFVIDTGVLGLAHGRYTCIARDMDLMIAFCTGGHGPGGVSDEVMVQVVFALQCYVGIARIWRVVIAAHRCSSMMLSFDSIPGMK